VLHHSAAQSVFGVKLHWLSQPLTAHHYNCHAWWVVAPWNFLQVCGQWCISWCRTLLTPPPPPPMPMHPWCCARWCQPHTHGQYWIGTELPICLLAESTEPDRSIFSGPCVLYFSDSQMSNKMPCWSCVLIMMNDGVTSNFVNNRRIIKLVADSYTSYTCGTFFWHKKYNSIKDCKHASTVEARCWKKLGWG